MKTPHIGAHRNVFKELDNATYRRASGAEPARTRDLELV